MIKINKNIFFPGKFPDGTSALLDVPMNVVSTFKKINISWHYENDLEFINLIYIVNHYKGKFGKSIEYNLYMPYIPNARMDRVKHDNEVFTLKWFAKTLNELEFDNVYVLDPHSDVSTALINNINIVPVDIYISKVIDDFLNKNPNNFIIYFPDAGAYKRYKDINCIKNIKKVYGKKVRNWETGKIEGLKIVDENDEKLNDLSLDGKVVLMIDDIISYGGTLYYSALELKKLGAYEINAYATHVEPKSLHDNEKGTFIKLLEDNTVNKLYTTNSIYTIGEIKDKIIVLYDINFN